MRWVTMTGSRRLLAAIALAGGTGCPIDSGGALEPVRPVTSETDLQRAASESIERASMGTQYVLRRINQTCGESSALAGVEVVTFLPKQLCVEVRSQPADGDSSDFARAYIPVEAIETGLRRFLPIAPSCELVTQGARGLQFALNRTGIGEISLACPVPARAVVRYSPIARDLVFHTFWDETGLPGRFTAIRMVETDVTPRALPSLEPPEQRAIEHDGMIRVPAGPFTMGIPVRRPKNPEPKEDEPDHEVTLDAFWIDRLEVTVGQYRECVAERVCPEPAEAIHIGADCNWGHPDRAQHPINCVTWNEAKAYCAWAGKRLPTEAEWEKSARGDDGRRYPWGNREPTCELTIWDEDDDGCGRGTTWPVGSRPADRSPYGVLDMSGNVSEWVADWYDRNYYRTGSRTNPKGPPGPVPLPNSTIVVRSMRGGNWSEGSAEGLRVTNRRGSSPDSRGDDWGVRCTRDDNAK